MSSKARLLTVVKDILLKNGEPTKWYNELGSTMTITECDQLGLIAGHYTSAVGEASKMYPLIGRFDTVGRTLGWIVSWQNKFQNANSTTAWSGQVQYDTSGKTDPVILTTWLLTSQTDQEDEWNSTNVGFDTFTQDPPDEAQILQAKTRRTCSHPKSVA